MRVTNSSWPTAKLPRAEAVGRASAPLSLALVNLTLSSDPSRSCSRSAATAPCRCLCWCSPDGYASAGEVQRLIGLVVGYQRTCPGTPRVLRPCTPLARQLRPHKCPHGDRRVGPLFRYLQYGGGAACMPLPEPRDIPHARARGPRADARTRPQLIAAVRRQWPPHLPARRRAGPGRDRSRALLAAQAAERLSRCSPSSPASSRPTGRARPRSGHRTAQATVDPRRRRRPSTASPTSWSSTTRSSSRHVGWLGRLELARHGGRRGPLHQEQGSSSAPRTSCSSPRRSGPAPRGRCSWR